MAVVGGAGLLHILFVEEMEIIEQMARDRIILRKLRDDSDPFQLPSRTFIKFFRLSKELCRYVINAITPAMQQAQRSTFVPHMLKVLATLHFYGHGSYQKCVGHGYLFGMSQPTLSRCISEVTEAINNILVPQWIRFPVHQHEKNMKKRGFMELFNMPGTIGAIDCTHVAIVSPPVENQQFPAIAYFNRKGYYSLNVQIICDSNLKILSTNSRFPGSTHDSAVWMFSNIRNHMEQSFQNGDNNTWLIGDSGYPLQPWLLTPFDEVQPNTPESRYNEHHILARNCIERLNGVLKQRFRCLLKHRVLHYDPVKAAQIIYSCGGLHNMATQFEVEMPEGNNVDNNHNNNNLVDDQLEQIQADWHAAGQRVRNNVLRHFNQ